ncbi:MAG TPA: GNAT family N-acetyltransferase [Candidatus Kapabacteria bacterium]|nr:GNAT family N-acetyltransferase [Candidatus Kapabacteria bacterium]
MPAIAKPSEADVRLAGEGEAGEIASVLYDAFVEYEPLYTPEAFAATAVKADRILSRWSEGPVWVALLNGEVVGTVAAVPRDRALYVRSMGIAPKGRGRGLGLLLLERAEEHARRNGFERLTLSTTEFLYHAIGLYRRFGFKHSNVQIPDLFGTPLFAMFKDL